MPDHHGKTTSGPADHRQPGSAVPADPALQGGDASIVRRTRDGWRVGGTEVPDLTCAMVLADLLASELPAELAPGQADQRDGTPASTDPAAARHADNGLPAGAGAAAGQSGQPKAGAAAARPRRAEGRAPQGAAAASQRGTESEAAAGDAGRMRATISQLEHALVARVRVEQAIGVLAERHRIQPRQAFEQLRTAARNRGKRVIDVASDVVASATNPLLQLPDELSRPRRSRRSRGVLEAE